MSPPLSSDEQEALLALGRLPLIGPARGRRLLAACGSATQTLAAPIGVWEDVLGPAVAQKAHKSPDLDWARQQLRQLTDLGGELVAWGDTDYPPWLCNLPDAPLSMYALGDRRWLRTPSVAIVGSRRCTSYGRRAASQIAAEMARHGITIVSGLARGIDGAAHDGALRADGGTIGVLGCGLDIIYPREHAALYRQIAEKGLLLAEAPLGTAPEARGFPKRNRIISGLSLAVIVAEAPQRSGALMTARLAREQGRDVFAIPGEITNPRCAGCLELLRDGAGLVRSARDVIDELAAHLPDAVSMVLPASDSPERTTDSTCGRQLLEVMERGEHDVEGLARQMGVAIGRIQQALLLLELSGHVVRLPGQRYARAS
ncbi:MAG: DNA-protecting protein DprA [Gemmatimonadetes bacterium]|nr:DNA-protecting protein DprA [Gemmatimonadota bacterium]